MSIIDNIKKAFSKDDEKSKTQSLEYEDLEYLYMSNSSELYNSTFNADIVYVSKKAEEGNLATSLCPIKQKDSSNLSQEQLKSESPGSSLYKTEKEKSTYQYKPVIKKHKVRLYYIVINLSVLTSSEEVVNKLLKKISSFGKDTFIKLIILSNSLLSSEYIHLDSKIAVDNIKDFINFYIESAPPTNTTSQKEFLSSISYISKKINKLNEDNKIVQEDKLSKYEVDKIFTIYYGYSSLNEISQQTLEDMSYITSHSETTYYLTQDETILISALGFRNIYLTNRLTLEEL